MEPVTKLAWVVLALIHAPPAAVTFAPGLVARYGVAATGDVALLLRHRGVLFLAVTAVCALAAVEPSARRGASVVVLMSVVGFLVVYARGGLPPGALRTVAMVDGIALAPSAWVAYAAWCRHAP
ncbi:MAG: hypothetical protein R3B06_12705 [Kofleriaceae bacterium]